MAIRVLLVDDHKMFCQGLRQILRLHPHIEVVGEAGDGGQAHQMVAELRPDVVVMDIHMPHIDGIQATRLIMQEGEPPAILILTMAKGNDYIIEAIRAGARGYYLKDSDISDLIEVIEKVSVGEAMFEPELMALALDRARDEETDNAEQIASGADTLLLLDEREVEILRRVAAGHSDCAIGATLGLTDTTIKILMDSIFHKLHLSNRKQATIYALRHGLVTLDELEA